MDSSRDLLLDLDPDLDLEELDLELEELDLDFESDLDLLDGLRSFLDLESESLDDPSE